MTRRRLHLDATEPNGLARRALCGHFAVDVTSDRGHVTCRMCRSRMAREDRELSELTEYVNDTRFMAETTRPLPQRDLSRRTALIWRDAFEGLARIIADHDERRATIPGPQTMFSSAAHALAEDYRVRLDGYAPASTHHPERLKRLTGAYGSVPTSAVAVPRGARTAEKVVEVRRALEMPLRRFSADCEGGPDLVYELTVRRYVGSTGPAEICEAVVERYPGLLARQVGRWTRGVFAEFSGTLMERGLIPTVRGTVIDPDDEGGDVGREDLTDADLFGWKAISEFLGVNVDTAQSYADKHGMPVRTFLRHVEAVSSELRAWRAQMTAPRKASGK